MALCHPELLTAAHDVELFSCGNAALDDWLKTRALSNQEKGFTAVTVVHEAGRVVGYYGLAPTVVLSPVDRRAIRISLRPGLDYESPDCATPLPCLLLGQLATDMAWTNRSVATALLAHALKRCLVGAQLTAAPAVIVNASSDETEFWIRRGFLASEDDPVVLFRSIPDIAASLQAAGLTLPSTRC